MKVETKTQEFDGSCDNKYYKTGFDYLIGKKGFLQHA